MFSFLSASSPTHITNKQCAAVIGKSKQFNIHIYQKKFDIQLFQKNMLNENKSRQTRQNTGFFVVGQGISNLPSSEQLPLTWDVLKYALYRKNLHEFKNKAPDLAFCSPLQHGTLFCELLALFRINVMWLK